MSTRFDLITIDVATPRSTAADLVSTGSFEIELDEDDGRWMVVASARDGHRFGLQRSDPREVESRVGSIDDVIDGCLPLAAPDPIATAAFFRSAFSLEFDLEHGPEISPATSAPTNRPAALLHAGRTVLRIDAGQPSPSNLHLDAACEPEAFDDELDRLVTLGATRVGPRRHEHWGDTQILSSPDGHLFCLNAYA